MQKAASAETPRPAWYDDYVPLSGVPDELIGPDGRPRGAWLNFLHQLSADERLLQQIRVRRQQLGRESPRHASRYRPDQGCLEHADVVQVWVGVG